MRFESRKEAGSMLASQLLKYKSKDTIVLALPRGGIVTGFEVAKGLKSPLDLLIVKKIGAPFNPELGIGATAEGNVVFIDDASLKLLGISKHDLTNVIAKETKELERRIKTYRKKSKPPDLKNKVVIIVDDGLATGVSAQAAIKSVKLQNPKKIIFAAPVCALDSVKPLKTIVDNVVCLLKPDYFESVGYWYRNFEQVEDEKVIELLKLAKKV